MKYGFCIVISKYKLHQCVALCHSLEKQIENKDAFGIFILCVDKRAYNILSKLKLQNVTLVKAEYIETEELSSIRKQRKINEYCWTLKPVLLEYVLENFHDIEQVIHLDADLYIFSNPIPIFEKQSECSILLSDHDFSEHHKRMEKAVGKTNSGIVSFKRDEKGIACIKWWKERCFEWCYSWVDKDRFSDQKYLDMAPKLFGSADYIKTPGVNIAPWNDAKHTVSLQNNVILVGENPLIIYHFCSFAIRNKREYYVQFNGCNPNPFIYDKYMKAVYKALGEIERIDPKFYSIIEK